jgi:hypothetical protein
MAEPGPGHYERAINALGLISGTFAEYGPGDDPEGGKANSLMILAMMAQARATLALVDELQALRTQQAALVPGALVERVGLAGGVIPSRREDFE